MNSFGFTQMQSRLNYIDNLRSFAMLLGILVHTTTLGDFGRLEAIGAFSDFFRMAAFFLVSGFFAALLLNSRPAGTFYRQRLINVVIPLVSALLILNPATLVLVFRYHNPALADLGLSQIAGSVFDEVPAAQGPLVWHLHLWFLFSLTFYVLMAGPMARLLQSTRVTHALDRSLKRIPAFLMPVSIAILTSLCVIFLRVFNELTEEVTGDFWLFRITLGYWPFYLLGMLLYWRKAEWDCIHRIDPFTFILALLVYLTHRQVAADPDFGKIAEAMWIFSQSLARCGLIFALLFLFRRYFDQRNKVSSALADSIYSIYIFHYITIYLIASFLIDTSSMGPLVFFSVAGLTALTTFALHRWIIKPIPVLRLMFNGRLG